jgi:hypothetical protein
MRLANGLLQGCADRSEPRGTGARARCSTGFPQQLWKTILAGLLLLAAPASARALEATVFASLAFPSEAWGTGFGGSLTSTWFKIVMFDAELARQGLESGEGQLLSFSVGACLAPSFGRLTPYAGFAVGLQRQTFGEFGDNGTLRSLMAGFKVKLGLVILRAEYRTFDFSGGGLLPLDHRVYAGAGLSF